MAFHLKVNAKVLSKGPERPMHFSLFRYVRLHHLLFSPITHSAPATLPDAHNRCIPTSGLLPLPFPLLRMLFTQVASWQAPLPPSGFCPVSVTWVRPSLVTLFKIAPLLSFPIFLPYLIYLLLIYDHNTFTYLPCPLSLPNAEYKLCKDMNFCLLWFTTILP